MKSLAVNRFIVICLTLDILKPVYGINCYKCPIYDFENDCTNFNETNELYPYIYTRVCDDSQYCIKTVALHTEKHITKRFCSSHDFGNSCHLYDEIKYDREKDSTIQYMFCIFTCDTDYCNTATSLQTTLKWLVLLFILQYIVIYT